MQDFRKKNLKAYHELQPYRIQEILLVSSLYDAFIFEEDGLLTEQLFQEYIDLNLHFAPRITQVSSGKEALSLLKERSFDLLISTTQIIEDDITSFFSNVKKEYPKLATALLTYSGAKDPYISKALNNLLDGIYTWNGDTSIFLVIIKIIEDKRNAEFDTLNGNVRVILVIEDSIKSYSSFLPYLYFEIMSQTKNLISESLNSSNKIFRMRARPKVLLANNFEQAISIFEKYQKYLLGIISDISFPDKDGKIKESGFEILKQVRTVTPDLPIVLFSSESWYRFKAYDLGATFIDKNSETLLSELRSFIKENLGFGDFIFRKANGDIEGTARDLIELENKLKTVSDESIIYHGNRNHFSNWLMARGEYVLANELRPRKVDEFTDVENLRNILVDSLASYRYNSQLGVIVDFSSERDFRDLNFVRIGKGSLGGKARGLAFLSSLINNKKFNEISSKYSNTKICIPKTLVIGTAEFSDFMEENSLQKFLLKDLSDEEIASYFIKGKIKSSLVQNLFLFLKNINYPLAVRSSSLLEDSHSQPFAGIYATYMIPNIDTDINVRLEQLLNAIKLIYASTFFKNARVYVEATSNRVEEEKMGIIVQEIVGKFHKELFYPDISGLARTVNYFTFLDVKPEDGIAYVALGLGRTVMEGYNSLKFCPKYPHILPQFHTIISALNFTQKNFYALNLKSTKIDIDESLTLSLEDLSRAEADGTLENIVSVFDYENNIIRDGLYDKKFPRIISFARILKYDKFPLANLISDILEISKTGIGCDVEIEFAFNLPSSDAESATFNLLQVRPMVSGKEDTNFELDKLVNENILCYSKSILGNGKVENVTDVVYVKKDSFDKSKTQLMAEQISKINKGLKNKAVFIGFGRWGSSDRWLGIPVNWENISNAAVLVETSLDNFEIEPSLGSHFFHNIISFGIGYLYINHNDKESFLNWSFLEKQKVIEETEYLKHIVLDEPLKIVLNGRKQKSVIYK